MRTAFPFNIWFLHQNYFFLLEKVKLKKHEFSHQWESLSHQARGQQFTAVESRLALSEMLLNHSFLFVVWLIGCFGFAAVGGV